MASRELKRDDWQKFFDNFSKKHQTTLVNLEVIGKELGDQTEIKWQPLRGISIDIRNNLFFIQTTSTIMPKPIIQLNSQMLQVLMNFSMIAHSHRF